MAMLDPVVGRKSFSPSGIGPAVSRCCVGLLCLLLLLPLQAGALGLGGMEVHSALHEPFRATIALREVDDLSERQVLATLAPRDVFERAGIERTVLLSDLQFSADFSDRDAPVLQVSSERPVREPFLSFVLEVRWPDGRLQREYTALVDPPDYRPAQRAERPPQPSVAAPAPASRVADTPAVDDREPPASATASDPASRLEGDRFGMTDRYDTLWSIAAAVRPSTEVSVQQTMLALHRLNPEAFVDGNINLLQAGFELRVPDLAEIERLGRQAASEIVAEHNAQWQQGTPGGVREQGALRLVADPEPVTETVVADEAAAADPGVEEAAAPAEPPAEVAEELETLAGELQQERSLREAAEMALAELRSEVDNLRSQLQLQHELLSELQASLERSRDGAPGPLQELAEWRWPGLGLLLVVLLVLLIVLRRRAARAEAGAGASAPARAGEWRMDEDPLVAADVAMAYGRFAAASRSLHTAIGREPERIDLRLKQLEALAESGDEAGFAEASRALESMALEGADAATLAELQARMGGNQPVGEPGGQAAAATGPAEAAGGDQADSPAAAGAEPEPESERGGPAAVSTTAVSTTAVSTTGDATMADETDEPVEDLDLDLDAGGVEAPRDLTSLDIDLDVEPLLDAEPPETWRVDPASDDALQRDLSAGAEEDGAVRSATTVASGDDDPFDFDLDLLPADSTGHDEQPEAPPRSDEAEERAGGLPEVEAMDLDLDLELSASEQQPSTGSAGSDLPEFDLDDMPDELFAREADDGGTSGDDSPLSVDLLEEAAQDVGDDDPVGAKLDLARAFVEHGDLRSAREYLQEVVREGDSAQQAEARALLDAHQ